MDLENKDWHEQFRADCKRGRELAEARLAEIEADSKRRQKLAEAKIEKIKAKSRRKRKIAEAKIKDLMTDSERTEWEREKWHEDFHKRNLRLMVVVMLFVWICGVSFGLMLAHFLITYGPRAGLP